MKKKKLGEILIERGSVSANDMESALLEQRGKTILLGDLLLGRGLVSQGELAAALAQVLKVEYVDLSTAEVDPEALKAIPQAAAVKHGVLPLYREPGKIIVAMADPQNLKSLDELRFMCGAEVSPRLAFRVTRA